MARLLLCCVTGLALASCASGYKPAYYYNEILIVNNSTESIRDVSISVADTGGRFGCANIAPLGICANRFPRRSYEYRPIRIDWVYAGEPRRTDSFVVDVPQTFYTGLVLRAVIDISPEGAVSAYFQQENPVK